LQLCTYNVSDALGINLTILVKINSERWSTLQSPFVYVQIRTSHAVCIILPDFRISRQSDPVLIGLSILMSVSLVISKMYFRLSRCALCTRSSSLNRDKYLNCYICPIACYDTRDVSFRVTLAYPLRSMSWLQACMTQTFNIQCAVADFRIETRAAWFRRLILYIYCMHLFKVYLRLNLFTYNNRDFYRPEFERQMVNLATRNGS